MAANQNISGFDSTQQLGEMFCLVFRQFIQYRLVYNQESVGVLKNTSFLQKGPRRYGSRGYGNSAGLSYPLAVPAPFTIHSLP